MTAREMALAIAKGRKYARIHPPALERVCAWALARYPKPKEAKKAAQAELHRLYGAYYPDQCHQNADKLISAWEQGDYPGDILSLSTRLLHLHTSTRERLPIMKELYALVSRHAGDAQTALDIGCGFHPFALPHMGLSLQSYAAADLNESTVSLLNRFFRAAGVQGRAYTLDIAAGLPQEGADLVFLAKLLPLLEQQEKGRAYSLMCALPAKVMVVTFPTLGLCGRNVGMETNYARFLEERIPPGAQIVCRQALQGELVYILKKG